MFYRERVFQSKCHLASVCTPLLAVCASLVTGCASYAPAPMDPQTLSDSRATVVLDRRAVRTELGRIAPDYAWNGSDWDEVTLLAAAIVASPGLASARATLAAAEADAEASRVAPGPALSLTAEYAIDPPEASNWLYGLGTDWLVDAGGRRAGRIALADVAARSARYDYAAALWTTRLAIRRALVSRSAWRSIEAAARDLAAMRQRQLTTVGRQVSAGELSRVELDRVRADSVAAIRTLAEATANASRANLELLAAAGLPAGAIDLDRVMPIDVAAVEPVSCVTPEQRARALRSRTDILQAVTAYDSAEAALQVAVASQYPEFHLGPGYTWERGLTKLPFTLGLTLPSLDLSRHEITAAEAHRTEAGHRLEAAVAAVEANIAQAAADYDAAATLLTLVRDQQLPTAAEIAAQADLALQAGASNRAEWAASQAGYLAARLDVVTAGQGLLDAEIALEDALHQALREPAGGSPSGLLRKLP